MLLPFQTPPIMRTVSTGKFFNQLIGLRLSQDFDMDNIDFPEDGDPCEICCASASPELCSEIIPGCTCD